MGSDTLNAIGLHALINPATLESNRSVVTLGAARVPRGGPHGEEHHMPTLNRDDWYDIGRDLNWSLSYVDVDEAFPACSMGMGMFTFLGLSYVDVDEAFPAPAGAASGRWLSASCYAVPSTPYSEPDAYAARHQRGELLHSPYITTTDRNTSPRSIL
jgi:hypothetical protein